MLDTTADARWAMAMPSPVATCGLVVLGYICPAPPEASMVAREMNLRGSSTRTSQGQLDPALAHMLRSEWARAARGLSKVKACRVMGCIKG